MHTHTHCVCIYVTRVKVLRRIPDWVRYAEATHNNLHGRWIISSSSTEVSNDENTTQCFPFGNSMNAVVRLVYSTGG